MTLGRWSLALALLLLALTIPADAQTPPRPKLDSKADTNDWEAYYSYGVDRLRKEPRRAYDAFYWASRLAPWSGDPLYARWIAFHMEQPSRFELYLRDDKKVLEDSLVQRADSIRGLAFIRNPFVHRTLEIALYDELPGRWSSDPVTRAWLAYARQNFAAANKLFGEVIRDDPVRYRRLRHLRATLFVAARQYDSARAEMTALVNALREVDERQLVRTYQSKAFYDYAIGRIEAVRWNRTAAREAFERALTEDLAYAAAHVGIATLARTPEGAAESYAQAVELWPLDGVFRHLYAVALLKARRAREGLEQINQALALEPHHAESYVIKGGAHEMLGQADSARVAYRTYLDRAARNAESRLGVHQRLTSLEAAPSPP
ncbi:MAG TPA: hypothetical protein VFU01_15280 [Gemmatimonadaceae bacterium]|nr:hypothetical protein [Gemmatimonadaceae bacterium]